MKQKLFKAFKFIFFILLALFALYGTMLVMERKQSHAKYHDFFENADKIDILLLGNSHVINGINPLKLYEETGFTAYNMGGHGAPMNATYWTFINALDYCTPELVLVDTNLLFRNYKYIDRPDGETGGNITVAVEQLHMNMDMFPCSENKRAAINDLIADESVREPFLFPASTYHNRWQELEWNDFLRLAELDEHNRLMGAEMTYGMARDLLLIDVPEHVTGDYETVCTTYLRYILDECRARDIPAIVTCMPFAGLNEDYADAKAAKRIAEEYGVLLLDFMDPAVRSAAGIDLRTDLHDSGHLNVIGADKVTAFIAAVLKSRDDLPLVPHRGDPAYEQIWGQRLKEYLEAESTLADTINDPFFLTDYIFHKQMRTVLFLQEKSALLQDPDFLYLIQKATGSLRVLEASERNEAYLLIFEGNAGPVEAVGNESFENRMTFLGKTSYVSSGAFHNLFANDRYENNFLDMEEYIFADLQIVTFDPEISRRYFTAHLSEFEMRRR